ncbi:MAG: BspA family leucine-rich repeat surface protein [Flavobacteriaceae bacterium]|nr:BspA family leucine-rich repeat surface protein [Bacteroidia bacterium]NNF74374.1 BspA family leucine-rich repeat surface protein [Flavobacteriaceae bacterium]
MNKYTYLLIFSIFFGFSQTPITDANFKDAIASCLSMNPIDGMCSSSQWGAMPDWDVSNVTDMSSAFIFYSMFNGDISGWNVSNVTNMNSMFNSAEAFNQNIGSWNVSNVTTMNAMFNGMGPGFPANAFNQDIGSWDVSNVTDMSSMFRFSMFNQDISSWDVGNNTTTGLMFWGTPFNQDIGGWNVSNVTNTTYMFAGTPFNQNIGGWNMSNVTSMTGMFWEAGSFNQDISSWNVGSVDSMYGMFYRATSFNQDISGWDVSNVGQMGQMFDGATAFDQNLGAWNITNVASMALMFEGVQLSTPNYDATLTGWAALPTLPPNITFSGGLSTYCNSESARNTLINTYGWTITDGGLDCTVGVEDYDISELSLYPNPARHTLFIKGYNEALDAMIFDLLGKQMLSTNVVMGEIDVKALPAGLYILRLSNETSSITRKFIKE